MSIDNSLIERTETGDLPSVLARWQDSMRNEDDFRGIRLYFSDRRNEGLTMVDLINTYIGVYGEGVSINGGFGNEHRFIESKGIPGMYRLCAGDDEYTTRIDIRAENFKHAVSFWKNPDYKREASE